MAYTCDGNGNLVTGTNGQTAFVYDDENRLVQWFWFAQDAAHYTNGALRTDFVYDGQGRLRIRYEFEIPIVAHTNDPGGGEEQSMVFEQMLQQPPPQSIWWSLSETRYIYDGKRVIQERDSNNAAVVGYTRGTDLSGSLEGAGGIGGLLARSTLSTQPSTHAYYFADGNGNIMHLMDSSQAVAARYRYDPFGNLVLVSGFLADANVYRFSSKELHARSGMYYYLYRFYEPNLQRWINRDPIGERGGKNLYAFVGNSPVDLIDRDGQEIGNPGIVLPPALPPGFYDSVCCLYQLWRQRPSIMGRAAQEARSDPDYGGIGASEGPELRFRQWGKGL